MTDPIDQAELAELGELNVHQAIAYGYALGARQVGQEILRQVAKTSGKIIDWDPDEDEAVAYLFGVTRRSLATRTQDRPATLREVAGQLHQAWIEFRQEAEEMTSPW